MVELTQGISTTLAIGIVVVAAILVLAGGIVAGLLKKLLVNTVLGLVVLLIINMFGGQLGIKLPITMLTLLASAIFGLAGVGVLILLALAGVKI